MCNSATTDQNENQNQNRNRNSRQGFEQEQTNLNKWLPVTASRKGKWWYSAFHNVTAMVGAGVLVLPFAMSQLGWAPGAITIIGSWVVTFYTLWQMVELHEFVPGRRFDRYTELGQHAFGQNLGYWIVMPQQMMVQVASDIVYMVTGGKSLKKCVDLIADDKWVNIRQTYFIMIFGGVQLLLSQSPNFNSLKVVSLLAAVMSISYSMIAFVASMFKGQSHSHLVRHGIRSHTTAGIVFDVFNSLGTIAFAFAGHAVVMEIQATIPSTEGNPSKKPMWLGCVVAYLIVAICYISVAFSGFWAFGDLVEDDVLVSLERPAWLIALANFMVFLHVIGSYQIFAMSVFDVLESVSVQRLHLKPGLPLRIFVRSTYVILTAFIGICLPFFGGLLGFFGGLAFSSTSYFLPSIIWLVLKKPRKWSFHWIISWICIIFGIAITILAPIGGLRSIIISAKTYKLFS